MVAESKVLHILYEYYHYNTGRRKLKEGCLRRRNDFSRFTRVRVKRVSALIHPARFSINTDGPGEHKAPRTLTLRFRRVLKNLYPG
jgi:hypothetical protein